jgi:hypothetical protein
MVLGGWVITGGVKKKKLITQLNLKNKKKMKISNQEKEPIKLILKPYNSFVLVWFWFQKAKTNWTDLTGPV